MRDTDAGDEAFVALVAEEHPGLVAASMMIVGSRATAEEIVQDVLERTYLRWNRVSTLDRPGAWVRRAVINRSISATRRAGSERRALDRLRRRRPPANTTPDPDLQEVWGAVRDLPANQARAVALHYGADLAVATVAEEMATSEPAVKALLHRARGALRTNSAIEEMAR